MLKNVRPVDIYYSVHMTVVGAEEHDDFESRTRGVYHYSGAEIPRR